MRGSNVMSGYWNNEQETVAAFRNGFFRTGDIGYQDRHGFYYLLDRQKDMIVTGGENVYSGEVEAVILTEPAVREVAVFGMPDAQWGEVVAASVVLKPGMQLTVEGFDPPLSTEPGKLQGSSPCGVLRDGFAEGRLWKNTETPAARALLGGRPALGRIAT